VDFIAMTENKRGHLGVPETGLMSKMNTRLKHLTHCYSHKLLQRLDLKLNPLIATMN
jgi:hypothetical protein